MNFIKTLAVAIIICVFVSNISVYGQSESSAEKYLQEVKNDVILTPGKQPAILKLLAQPKQVVAIAADHVFTFTGKKWHSKKLPGKWQTGCIDFKGTLWIGAPGLILNVEKNKKLPFPDTSTADSLFCMFWEDPNTLFVGTSKGLYCWKDEWKLVPETAGLKVRQIASGEYKKLWLATSGGLFCRENDKWLNLNGYVMDPGLKNDFYALANGPALNDIIFGSSLAVSQIAGDGEHWNYTGEDGLPFGPVTVLSYSKDDLWIGTPNGAIKKDVKWHYYHGKRWLPNNHVNDILRIDPNTIWIATPEGISEIRNVEMSLDQKSQRFETRLNQRHLRHNLVSDCQFSNPGDTTTSFCTTNDNDGLWTAIYLAAESFRYATTKSKDAYDNAVRTFLAMEKLQTVNPIPGFVARSYVAIDESTGHDGEWHVSSDGKWKWKGDTSSDEIVGHMFAYPIFYELVADETMKKRVKEVVRKLMSHIVDYNFQLVDLDGKATRWGVWTPDSLNNAPKWRYEKGINSLQILSFLESAYFVTGDSKFDQAYQNLINDHHYDKNMIQQKMFTPFEINHSDDELAFLPYYCLLRYTRDARLKETYSKSLLRSWKVEQPDKNPLWNIIASAGLERDCEISTAIEELQNYPMDIICWDVQNSHRWDLHRNPLNDRFNKPQATRVIPVAERGITKWNSNPYYLDYRGNGTREDDGAAWLLPYWMGKYHGFIKK